jgi:hypothetical protein
MPRVVKSPHRSGYQGSISQNWRRRRSRVRSALHDKFNRNVIAKWIKVAREACIEQE